MSTILDKLEALDKEATPGPWLLAFSELSETPLLINNAVFSSKQSPEQQLIAEMRNALPALLAVARAANLLVAEKYCGLTDCDFNYMENYNSLKNALAALEQSG